MALVAATFPTDALGATVSRVERAIRYEAAAGEQNRITITAASGSHEITDTGATITAGPGCASLDLHHVRCDAEEFDTIRVRAGDLDDTVSAAGSFFLGGTRADFRGGDGDDSLFGSDADDRLSGGDGDDRLEARDGFRTQHLDGGAGDDILVGGDAERFEHFKGGPGADVLSGGPRDDIGVDIARYRDRVTRVTVTLDDVANDGARGEGDNVLRNMEGAVGGRANDRFIGNGRANYFAGGAGNDVLDGRGQRPGGDELSGGSGDDVIRGSDGVDYIFANEGDDFVHGRNGRDELDAGPGSDTLDARDCGPDIVAGGRGRDVARLDRADLARAIEVSIRSRCAVVTG